MKYYLKILSLVLALLTVIAVFASCVKKPGADVTTEAVTERQTEQVDENWDYQRDPSLPDYATRVNFNATNLDSDFNVTGRGRVTVELCIDGDTAHFWNNSKTEILKIRFLAIDTPESTGKVEPWGKPASVYTKTKLQNAAEIALESDTEGEANFDSTGSRYLAWVWYRNEGSDVWRNLNIEILSEGLAMGKSTSSNRYGVVATEALTSARSNRLNLYSGKKDPLFYYGESVDLSIKSLVLNKESYSGIKVRFEGVVTKKSGEGIYVQSFDEDTQQYYGVYVYGGYASLAPKFLVVGYKLRIAGTADNNENFGFQVSGLSFSMINPSDDDVKIIEKDVKIEPTVIDADKLNNDPTLENTLVKIENITVKSVYTTTNDTSSSKGAMTLTCSDENQKTVTVRTVVLTSNGETVTEEYFKNKKMNVTGIIEYYEGSAQLKLFTLSDAEILN